ncbi:MAG: hypothetical protein V3U64_01095 [Cocleimonas sp.]
MNNPSINQSRRKLIKTLGYGMALTAGGASAMAMASGQKLDDGLQASALPTCDISICQQQTNGKEIVSLMNLSDKPVTLDAITPVGLEHVNGSLVVKLNNVSDGAMTIAPGERFSFEVEAISEVQNTNELQIPNVLAGHLKISSEHPAFNGIVPVTVFDSQVA